MCIPYCVENCPRHFAIIEGLNRVVDFLISLVAFARDEDGVASARGPQGFVNGPLAIKFLLPAAVARRRAALCNL